jgi:hypothetical protein
MEMFFDVFPLLPEVSLSCDGLGLLDWTELTLCWTYFSLLKKSEQSSTVANT